MAHMARPPSGSDAPPVSALAHHPRRGPWGQPAGRTGWEARMPIAGGQIRTPRLVLEPISWRDMDDMARLKADAGAFGMMLGGIRSRQQAESDMADDLACWARRGVGIFAIREDGRFIGMTGLHERPDGRGLGLRFALWPWAAGRGLAREAASAVLSFAHDAGIRRVIAVTRDTNIASRTILGGIGMTECGSFARDGHLMLVYESVRDTARDPLPPLPPRRPVRLPE
ncbi:putative N-acetyltransferase protein [Gluconacetobacter diazotrophicus PA1 5]|uniref:Putative N-acetyltransferase protein n=2 Tax=Gluconacetobacter diazotrophicus TaxID=33996 RepID=A9H4F8_GLUDA|nr:putative N-acetyltransferase protein [Gluconacetobacter diazotrophicus PA1 5]